MKIAVTGANGQLGKELQALQTSYPAVQFYFFTKEELNIADTDSVLAKLKEIQPQYCFNCAAYTAVDKAESDSETAFLINQTGAKNLAVATAALGIQFIHISTDYVFDGNGKEPYLEEHPTNPQNVYGLSKLKGEEDVMANNPQAIIIRTAWVYSEFGNNFVKTMLRLMQSKPAINVVADQYGIPTYAADLAKAMMIIAVSGKWAPGIYHYSNEGKITWFDFAKAIQEYINSTCKVNAIPTSEYPTPASRPAYSVLSTKKIQSTYNISIPDWKESLMQCLKQLKKTNCW
jgi:dTDP-4-dehydrorhamnose reductase